MRYVRYRATLLREPTAWRWRVEIEDRQGFRWIGYGNTITDAEADTILFRDLSQGMLNGPEPARRSPLVRPSDNPVFDYLSGRC